MTSHPHSQPVITRAPAAWRKTFSQIKALALSTKTENVPDTLAHIIRLCIDAGSAPPLDRIWSEDAAHENGNYECLCCECDQVFIGHKRRVVCKACSLAGSGVLTEQAADPVTDGQMAAWLFYDCSVAVYACGDLAEEILKYFEVRPLPGVELVPAPPSGARS